MPTCPASAHVPVLLLRAVCLLCYCCCALQEFRRLDSQLGAARDRAELLGGGADTLPLLSVQVQSGTGALLRERATLNTSTNYVSSGTALGWWGGGQTGAGMYFSTG